MIRNIAAGLASTLLATSFAQASTYNAYSHEVGNSPEHSVWFSGNSNPAGAAGTPAQKPNHFLFENSVPGFGLFDDGGSMDIGTKATLTGRVANAAMQAFDLVLNLVVIADPGAYKVIGVGGTNDPNDVPNDWIYYGLSTTSQSTLTYVSGSGPNALQSFDISLRGAVNGTPLAAQVGIGANDKNSLLFGLSTWIKFTDNSGNCTSNCSYNGDINIVLGQGGNGIPNPVPVPAAGLLLLGGLGGLGVMSRRKRRKTA